MRQDLDLDTDEIEARREYFRRRNRGGKLYPCPTCERPRALTAFERSRGYQCDRCADRAEGKEL